MLHQCGNNLLWMPYGIGQAIIFLPCGFFFYLSSFFPHLISAVADWMSAILAHMVWPWCKFRMQVWNVLHGARWKCRTQKLPSGHHCRTLSGYIFAIKACIDNRKKNLLNSNISYMSSQYGELYPTTSWDHFVSLGHPNKFQRVSRLGSVTARHLVVGVSQTLRPWTEGATYIWQGGHHVDHWSKF